MIQSKYKTVFDFEQAGKGPTLCVVTFSALTGYFMSGSRPVHHLFSVFRNLFPIGGSIRFEPGAGIQARRFDEANGKRPIPAGEISGINAFILSVF